MSQFHYKIYLIFVFFIVALLMQPVHSAGKHKIKIGGNQAFKTQVSSCLDLLADKYPKAYEFVDTHIGIIGQFHRSGMLAWKNPPLYQMSDKTAFYSISWCASSIAHDAYHSYLYKKHKPSNGQSTPNRYWADFKAERKAIQYQIRVAKQIGAPKHEMDYLSTLNGQHADVDGDGQVTNKDYLNRDW